VVMRSARRGVLCCMTMGQTSPILAPCVRAEGWEAATRVGPLPGERTQQESAHTARHDIPKRVRISLASARNNAGSQFDRYTMADHQEGWGQPESYRGENRRIQHGYDVR
jgi:hypothetical protein